MVYESNWSNGFDKVVWTGVTTIELTKAMKRLFKIFDWLTSCCK